MDPVSILLTVLIILLVAWGAFWLIDRSIPGQFNTVAKVFVGVLALILLLTKTGFI